MPRRNGHLIIPRSCTNTMPVTERGRDSQENAQRAPQPIHRHAAPSGPWPFLDVDTEIRSEQLENLQPLLDTEARPLKAWSKYPQSLYPNWTSAQQKQSGITKVVNGDERSESTIYHVNVSEDATFTADENFSVKEDTKDEYWEKLKAPVPEGIRLRALFLEKLTGPVLQMLGTKYNIEPFFFSSSLNWTPSRYREADGEGDHITVTLTFIRSLKNTDSSTRTTSGQLIDPQAPLPVRSTKPLMDRLLYPDLLAIHLIRSPTQSTLISYHASDLYGATTAAALHTRLLAAGRSVYWKKIFATTITADPTFVLLALLWYPLYAFDESFTALYNHICELERRVMETPDLRLTQQLHIIRAHLLYYASLLEDLRKTVKFVRDTWNPALRHPADTPVKELMQKESTTLLNEIERLEKNCSMQESRLKNVVDLAFSSVNLEDSKQMQRLTRAALRDSAAMKQISYLTMFFLPASLAATIFGMNVKELSSGSHGTLLHYVATMLPLTIVTVWIIVAVQYRKRNPNEQDQEEDRLTLEKMSWPLTFIKTELGRATRWATASSRERTENMPVVTAATRSSPIELAQVATHRAAISQGNWTQTSTAVNSTIIV
ncbi:hypothetical protein MVEN_02344600 [Mycena venus]|uniref:Uncharacterized protein n=1 Tax=Mycena venus TaxID=2733690 RepID=A0A8H6X4A6_9AGAR|nr:hypothetical protein MVEN_02344600 [Mycena venus]